MQMVRSAQELIMNDDGMFFTNEAVSGIPTLTNVSGIEYFPAISDSNYVWIDNTGDDQKFCVYAKLESEKTYFAVSHKGYKEVTSIPTGIDCW